MCLSGKTFANHGKCYTYVITYVFSIGKKVLKEVLYFDTQ